MDNNHHNERLKLVEAAIDEHGASLLAFLKALTRNPQDAEELFDDLWMFVLRRFKTEDIGEFGLLRRKAQQLFIDRWRKQKRNPIVAFEEVPESPVSSHHQDVLSDEENAAFKKRFFAEHPIDVPDIHKDALWLYARHGYTFSEIGKILEKPSSTVGDWVASTRITLAEYLNSNP